MRNSCSKVTEKGKAYLEKVFNCLQRRKDSKFVFRSDEGNLIVP